MLCNCSLEPFVIWLTRDVAPARAVAVSLAFSEGYTPEKVEEVAVQQTL
jgi:hypothetical protein